MSKAIAVEVIDLCGSPENGTAVVEVAAVAAAAASRNNDPLSPSLPSRKRRRLQRQTSIQVIEPQRVKSDPNERNSAEVTLVKVNHQPVPPEVQVLEVVPDVAANHVQELLTRFGGNVEYVIAHLLENRNYPKSKTISTASTNLSLVLQSNERTYKYDYMLPQSFEPSAVYLQEAKSMLLFDFPFLTQAGAQAILKANGGHFAIAYDKIVTAIKGKGTRPGKCLEVSQYEKLLRVVQGAALDPAQTRTIGLGVACSRIVLKQPRSQVTMTPLVTDEILRDELAFVKEKMDEWISHARQLKERNQNTQVAKASGTAVDCSCCFDQFAIGDMVACRTEGHLFCVDCLRSYVEGLVYGSNNLGIDKETKQPALEIKCFHGDGCSSGFERSYLEKSLSHKALAKYDEIQFRLSIEKAGLHDTMASCPKCGFQAALPQSFKIFYCPVEGCRYESCRACGEAAHIPLRCDEVEKEKETKSRLTVEEAITAAKIRKCPKCGKANFIKSDGCNKMTCPSCRAYSCYVCRQPINGYEHFCNTPHCNHKNCGKCSLWSNPEEDDKRAMKEAGLKAASEVSAQVDVESLLKEPPK